MHGQKVEETEVKALLEIANRTIYQFPFRLPKSLVLYMRMLSILEGVCLALDPKFRFVQILGNVLEEEGLVDEAYQEEIKGSDETDWKSSRRIYRRDASAEGISRAKL